MRRRRSKKRSNALICEELEPRILLSADLVGVAVDPASNDVEQQVDETELQTIEAGLQSVLSNQTDESDISTRELVIIDPATPDYQSLVDDLISRDGDGRSFEIVLLDSSANGIEQLNETLAQYQGLNAIHLISHGGEGEIRLGNATLNQDGLHQSAEQISAWGEALNPGGDWLIYGCDIASTATGERFIEQFAALTGADVAASNDVTGHETLGGDWDLEVAEGSIETDVAVGNDGQEAWLNRLDTTTGLLGHWTLDSNATDSSGNSHNGTLTNGASIDNPGSSNPIGSGNLNLDGFNDFVQLSSHVSAFSGLSEGTIAAWINTADPGVQTIFSISDTADFNSLVVFGMDNGRIFIDVANNGFYSLSVQTNASYADGNWHHVAVTVDGSGNSLYIDGVKVSLAGLTYTDGNASTTNFFSSVTSLDSMEIGIHRDSGGYIGAFDGLQDDVRVYDRALSDSDIAELLSNTAPTFDSAGPPSFTAHTITSSANGSAGVSTVDMDGDGDLDVVSASQNDNKIAWYENDGSQNFTAHTISTSANTAFAVTTADVDGDGDMDVLSASIGDDKIAWYENDGNENFTAHTITLSADIAASVAVADVDGDGDIDVLSASVGDDRVVWYENDGNENFTTRTITFSASGASFVGTVDLDEDGDLDVLSTSAYDGRVAWYENDGNENFTTRTVTTSAYEARQVIAADVDGDGDLDLLSASRSTDKLAWYENNGSESFTLRTITAAAGPVNAVAAADIDNDGDLDVISASTTDDNLVWFENDGSENFTANTIGGTTGDVYSVAVADMDGDGDVDILATDDAADTVTWYENVSSVTTLDGAPTFVEDGAAVVLDADVDVKDAELDALNSGLGDYDGASVTLVRNGAANSDDVFGFNDGNGITLSGSNLIKSSQIIASFDTTTTAGELVITFTNANGQTPTSADVDNILRQITYSNSNDAPPASVQIDWTLDDGNTGSQGSGGALQAVGSTTVTITAVNDDPTNAGSLPTDITVAENVSSNVDLSAVDFSDVDAGAGTVTVTLTTSTGGNLSAAAGTGITIGGTSTARTLTGTLTDLNNYFNTASNITYLHGTPDTNGDNADTINVTINDNGNTGTGGGTNINLGTVNVDITPDNDVPTITNLGGDNLAYSEDDGAQVIDQGTASVVADVDSSDFDTGTLTVSFQAGSDNAEDVLAIRDQGAGPTNITVSGSAVSYGGTQIGTFTGGSGGADLVITLDADANATAVTALVRNITYENTDTENPTTGARTVRFVLTDGDGGTSVDYDTTVTVSTVNDAPTLAATAANDTLTENTDTTSGAVFATVTIDPIEGGDDITLAQLTLGGGIENSDTLTINGTAISGLGSNSSGAITGGHSYSYTQATGVVTITFAASTNAAAAELVLESITYGIDPADQNPSTTARTVTLNTVTDNGGGSDTSSDIGETATISVGAVNDDPSNAGSLPSDISVTEDVSSNVDLSAVDFSDVDAASGTLTVTLTTSTGGNLSASAGTGITIGGSSTARTLTGTLTDLNNYFNTASNITYLHGTTNTAGNDADTINVTINDNGNTGSGGGTDINMGTVNVDITAVNDAPTLAATAANDTLTENSDTTSGTVFGTVTIDPIETGDDIASAQLTLGGGIENSDTLTINGTAISGLGSNSSGAISGGHSYSYTQATGVVTITFAASTNAAAAELVLESITYGIDPADQNPSTTARTVTLNTVTDNGGGSDTSSDVGETATISVGAVNDDPSNAGSLPSNVSVAEDVSSNIDLSAVDFSDVDAASGTLTVTLTTSTGGNLSASAGTGITIGGSSIARTLTGTLNDLNNYFNTASNITYLHGTTNTNGNDADTINVTINDNGNTGSGGGTDVNLGTVNVDIGVVNDAPTFNVAGTPTFTQNIISTETTGSFIASVDLDGDGDIDILANSGSTDVVSWYENDGDGNFTERQIGSSDHNEAELHWGDLDSDGDLDVVSTSYTGGQVFWYENDGAQNFTEHAIPIVVAGAYDVRVADLNEDGSNDLVVAAYDVNDVLWLENDGSENFTSHTIEADFSRARDIEVVDFDGDGDLDVIGTAFVGDKASWFENDGSENFTERVIATSIDGPRTVHVADIDDDGDLDVVTVTYFDGEVSWHENDGSHNFTEHVLTNSAVWASMATTSDVDGDGDIDILYASDGDDTVAWFDNDGNENFTERTITTTADRASEAAPADIDGDGDIDVVTISWGDNTVAWYENSSSLVNTLDGNPTFVEGGAAVVLDADVDVSDPELDALNGGAGDYHGASLTLVRNGGANADDVFSFNDGNGITLSGGNLIKSGQIIASFDTTTTAGELVVTFTNANGQTATSTDVDNILRQITYENGSENPPASAQIDWTLDDGNTGSQGSGGALQAVGSTTVTITAVNDDPTITNLAGDGLAYTEGDGPQVIEQGSNAAVSDVDSGNFDMGTLTVAFQAGSDSAEDVLAIRDQGAGPTNITVSGSAVSYGGTQIGTFTGGSSGADLVITLDADADATALSALIQNITYENTDTDTPTAGARTVRFVLTDGDGGTSIDYDTTVTVSAVNDDPTNAGSLPSDISVTEDVSSNVDLSAIDFSDVDAGAGTLTVTLTTSTGGDLTAAAGTGITIGGTSTARTLTGTLSDLNTYFNTASNITYLHGTTNTNGNDADTINVTINDNGNTGSGGGTNINLGTVNVDITWVNDAPTLAASTANDSLTENSDTTSGAVFATVTIDPIEAGDDIASAQLTLGGGIENSDTLTINGTAISGLGSNSSGAISGGHSYSYTQATGVVTITFAASTNAAAAELVLESITYGIDPADQNPSTTARTITLNTVTDNGGGSDTSSDISETATISVGAVNDDPSNAGSLPSDIAVTEDVSSNVDLSALDFSDVDADSGTLTVTLTTSTGGNLSASAGTGITIGGSSTARTLTGTLTDLNNYFNTASNITYLHGTTNTNGNDADTINVTINDNGNTGSGGGTDIDLGTVNVDISAVNDAPLVVGLDGDVHNFTEGDGVVLIEQGGDAVVSDSDSSDYAGGSLTVEVDSGLQPAEDRFSIFNQGTDTGEIGLSGGNVTYSGTLIGTVTGGTGVDPLTVTFNSNATSAAVTALVRNITYENSNLENPADGTRSITIDITDGDGASSLTQNLTLNVSSVNDAPVVDLNGADGAGVDFAVTFTEDGGAVNVVDTDATISDVDNTTYQNLSINLSGFLDGASEQITIAGYVFTYSTSENVIRTVGSTDFEIDFDGTGFDVMLDGGGGMPAADLQSLLRGVTYENTFQDPTAGDRTINFFAQDSSLLSGPIATSTITVNPQNDAPTATDNTNSVSESGFVSGNAITDDSGSGVDSDPEGDGLQVTQVEGGAYTPGLPVTLASGAQVTFQTNGSYTYNTNGQFDGLGASDSVDDNFTYQIGDGNGGFDTATVTITINGSNNTPSITSAGLTLDEGQTVTLGDANFAVTDADDTDFTYTVSGISGGYFQLSTNPGVSITSFTSANLTGGLVQFVDDGNEVAPAFSVTVNDGDIDSNTLAATINFTLVSDSTPVANIDSITVAEGGTVTTLDGGFSTVLNNDTGLVDAPVTVSLVSDVTNGSLTLNGDGTFSYTHDGSENFTDSFTYRVTDNDGQTADATVTINVTPVSDETPVANADSISVGEGGTITTLVGGSSTVLNNDTGLGDTPVTVSLVTDVTNGSLTLNGDGTFSYTHDGSENFTDSFTYRVTDNDGEMADATVTINVTPVSDETPVANADSISVAEGGTITTLVGGSSTVLNNDTGLGDTPVTVSLITDVTNGSLTLNGDGTFSYTHDGSENFTDSFTYRVTDNDGETADATVTINVTPVSDATPVANADSITVAEGGTITTLVGGSSTVLNNDTGLGDTPVTVSLITDVTNGSLTLNGDGTFSYTHDGSENFTDSFTYRVTDNDGETADATVTINVTPVSDETPVANADSITVAEGGTITTLVGGSSTVLNNDTGLGDTPVTVSLVTDVVNGSLTLNGDGTFSYTHDGSENFTDSFTYRVTDNDGETADATVTINVTPVSDETPVANADSITVAEGGTITTLVGGSSTVLNNDTGLGDTPVTVSLVTDVVNGSLTLNGDGTFSYTHDGSENFTDSFTYRVTDNDGEMADATVTINVTPVSDETPVANADSISIAEGGTITTLVGGSSTVLNNDTGLGDTPVTVSLITDVTNGSLTLNGDGTFSYTHDGSENFTDSFTYRVTDNDGETADATVTINVTPVSDETPVANADSITVAEGGTITTLVGGSSTVLNNDTGLGDTPVTVSLVTDVVNGSLTLNGDGTFSYTHDGSENFTDSFTYRVTDNDGETADATVTINVTPVSDETPVANADSITVAEGGTITTLVGGSSTVLNNDTGLGDTPVTVSLVTDVTNGSLTLNGDGTFSYTHDSSENFTDSFTYRVTDNDGQTADATVTINVTPVSDATPVANADSITVAEGGTITTLVGGSSTVLNNDTGLGDTPVTVSLVTDVTNGSLTLNGDGTFSYSHDGSENFTDSFTYRVTDNDGQTADATVTINVTPVSDETPVANADSITVAEGGTVTTLVGGSSTVLNNDTGLGDTPVTVSLITDVTNGSLTLNGDGTFSYTHDGSENFTDSFTYRVTDNDGETADATVTINVTPVSDETPVSNADSISVAEGGTVTTLVGGASTVLNNDTGLGDTPVTVSLVTDVTNGSLTLNGDGTFSYTHDGSENFTDSFTYRVTDNDGQTADATVTINVTPVSDETPVANADSISVAEGGTITTLVGGSSTVLNNDTGLGDTPVTVSLITDVTNGSLTLNGDGTFSYTHDGSENFTDSFTYRVTDNDGETADATVTINVTPVSDETPVANADSITVAEGGTITTLVGGSSTVLNNDTGLGDTPVTVSLITDVTNGSLTLNGDGTFSYTHDGSENFTDSFTYRVTDNDGQTADATVTINVTPVSDETPVANADSISVAEGGTITTLVGGSSTVLNNDTGLGDTPVTVSLITDVTNGSLTLNGDGTFSYTHDGSENFTDSFTYRVTDNDGQTADATVTINVTPVSDATPVANADSITVAEGGTITTLVGGSSTVLNNDTGLGDTPVTVSLVTDVTNGSLTLNGDGTFSYSHDGSENFTDSFTYRITDNDGQTADATVTINVTPVSDATPVANADSISVAEGGTITTLVGGSSTVLNNDTGLGDTPVTVSLITDVTNGSLTLNGDGTFSYTHDGSENFTDSFTYRVTDNDGQTADATVTINVTPVSDATPVANADSITVVEGGTITTLVGGSSTVLNNDTGLGDTPVTVSLVTDVVYGALTLNSDGTFSYTHDGSENFTDSFTYRVTDNDGETADATVTITVTPVSDETPVANADSITVAEGGTITTLVGGSSTVLNNDTGLGDTPVTVSLVTDVTNGSLTLNGDGTFSYTHDGSENFTDSFTYRVTDNDGQTADATVTINVTPVSDETPVANADSISVAEGGTITTLVGGSSTVLNNDTGLGDTPVTVSLVTDVTNGSLTLNGDGTFSYTHDGSENFTDSFTYRVTDNDGQTADATVTINVTPVSDETPVANADSITVAEGGTITTLVGGSSTVLNNDTGLGDTPVTVSLVTDVVYGALTLNSDGTFSYTHDGSENFTDSFTYRVTDNDGETADATVTITVTPVSDETPVANADSITVAEGGTITTLVGGSSTVLNNDTGLGDTPVTVSLVTDVVNGSLTLNGDGTFSYTHDGSENFTDSFTYRVTDNDGETADATVTINVTPVSDETPVANADSITVAEGGTITTLVGGSSTVLNNDTGLGDTPVTVSLVTDVTNGSLTLNGDGTFSYTHDGSENFTDSFTYRVTDNDGQTADATVTINVTPVSDETPVANADSITVAEGGTITTLVGGSSTVLNNDTGLGDTPVTVSLVTDVVNGALTLNSDGTFSYTHDGSENFTDSFIYRITDNDGETSDTTVAINVTPVSDTTPVANADSITVAEGGTATTLDGGFSTVLNNDTGLGDTPVTVSLVTDVTNGSLTLNGDGTFSYTHDGSGIFTDSFIYRVTDNDGQTSDTTVTINVVSTNNPPEASDVNVSVLEDTVYTGNLPAAVDDDGDTVTYRLESNPVHGSITLEADGGFSYTPDADYHGADSFVYSVSDGNGGNNSYLVEIDVVSVNDSPVITSHGENENVLLSLEENSTLVTMVTADDPENDAISFAIDGGADLGLFSIDSVSGEMVFNHAPDMENPLDADQDNLYQVQVLVSDGNGGTDRQSFTIEVTDVDEFDVGLLMDVEDTPDAIPLSGSLNDGVGITVWAEDPDSSNNRITYSLEDDSNGLFAIDPANGTITLASTVENRDASQFEITVRATSEDGSYSLHTFRIALNRVVDPPPEPEQPYLDDIIFDLDPEEPAESQATTGPSQQPPTDTAAVSEELSSEDQEASLSTGIEEPTRVVIDDIERPAIERLSPSLFSEDSRNSYRYDYYQARLTPVPVAPEELPAFDTSIGELIEVPEAIWHLLDSMNSEMSEHQREQVSTDKITVLTATFGTLALSAGYVAWLLRAGVLSASLLSFMPLWRQIDPLPVLSAHAKRRDEDQDHPPEEDPDEKRLAKLFDRKKKPVKNRSIFFRKDS